MAARLALRGTHDGTARPDHAGCAQLYAALHGLEPEAGWDEIGHRFLRSGLTTAGPAGLFNRGLAGLGVAAALLKGGTGRYGNLLAKVDGAIALVENHDLIEGVTGVGVYLLMRPLPSKRQAVVRSLAKAADGDPPFHVPPHRVPQAWSLPRGYADCGLAHGAAGPLALLALLSEEHADVPAGTIARIADWLRDAAHTDEWGIAWPAGIAGRDRLPSPRRASWCYGVPGIARALWLAGRALDEPGYQELAREAMAALLDHPEAWGIGDSPNLCHGLGGLLLVTAAFAADDPRFAAPARELLDRILGAFDPDLPLGFDTDGPGLLTGAAGVALTLLTVTGDRPDPAARPFLVA
ncbi:lanthionine synthetase C family protein [Actinoallomurus sp. CA-142502]|uniref:lanthionine synthetase C family protein n=1 Tax=Actinoallomurus sp. CA-142502 TaxID=3239885 RepID=UPI003D93ED9B